MRNYFSIFVLFVFAQFFTFASLAKIVPGKSAGQVSVTLSGSSQYTMPLTFPKGTAGMEPKLFLSYDSNSGPGHLGLGWSLTGLTQITRINRTKLIDRFPGAVDFDDPVDGYSTDALALDGARLVPAPEGGVYLSKSIDDQTRVWSDGQKYIAKTKAGLTIIFGESPNSRIQTASGGVYVWAVSRIIDTFGNQIFFFYRNDKSDWGPRAVYWTVHSSDIPISSVPTEAGVKSASFASTAFQWEQASPSPVSINYMGGQETRKSHFIKSITSYAGSREFRKYQFEYEQTNRLGNRILKSIQEFGADVASGPDEYGKTRFSYTTFEPQWNEVIDYGLPDDFGDIDSVGSGYRLFDFDGDGDKDLLYSAHVNGQAIRRSFLKDSAGWKSDDSSFPPPPLETDFSTNFDHQDPVVFYDINGDQKKDILFSRKNADGEKRLAFVASNGSWSPEPNLNPPFLILDGENRVAHVSPIVDDGSEKLLVWRKSGAVDLFSIDGGAWQQETLGNFSALKSEFDLSVGEFRCGTAAPQIAALSQDGLTLSFFEITTDAAGAKSLEEIVSRDFTEPVSFLSDVNDNGCSKVAVFSGNLSVPTFEVIHLSGSDLVIEQTSFNWNGIAKLNGIKSADVDGTGRDSVGLILPARIGEPNIIFLQFDGTDVWSHNNQHDYVPLDSSFTIDSSYRFEGAFINNDDAEDFLLLPNGKGVVARALINNGSGFDQNADLVPDIGFAVEEKVGASPQFVDINADGLVDLLGYHIDKDGKTVVRTTQINVRNGWDNISNPDLLLPHPISNEKGGTVGSFIDFNSDGIADFVYAGENKAAWGAWKIKFDGDGVPLKWELDSRFKLPEQAKLSHKDHGDMGVRFFDANGDGRVDVIVSRRKADGMLFQFAGLNTGAGWSDDQPQYHPPIPFVSRYNADVFYEAKSNQAKYYRNLRVLTQDVNGDGLVDLFYHFGFKKGGRRTAGCLNNPSFINDDDGTPIIIPHRFRSNEFCAGVYYQVKPNTSPKSAWKEGRDSHMPPVQLDLSIPNESATLNIVDFNGDGLVDVASAWLSSGSNRGKTYLNTGKGWATIGNYVIPANALTTDKKLSAHRTIDLNGDGLIDIVFSRPDEAQRGAYFNTGNGFAAAPASFKPKRAFFNAKGEDLGIRFADVDGNGMPDMLESFRKKDGGITQSAFLNSGATDASGINSPEDRADMLKTVTNSMGLVTTLKYQSLLTPRGTVQIKEDDFYTPSTILPFTNDRGHVIISHVPTMYAVRTLSYVDTDGSEIGTRYQYKGFRFDLDASSPLGFESRIAKSFVKPAAGSLSDTGIIEKVNLYQDYFFNGKSKHEEAIVDEITTNVTETKYLLAEQSASQWPKRVLTASTHTTTRDISTVSDPNGDPTGTTSQYLRYDQFNNATKVCVEYGDGSRTLTDNTYDLASDLHSPSVWYLGRLIKAEVTHFRTTATIQCSELLKGFSGVPPNERLTNIAEFEYDIQRTSSGAFRPESTGVLKSETSNAGHSLAVRKSYEHDKYGNVIKEIAVTGDIPARSKSMIYSENGRFATSESNALGHTVRYEIDSLMGLVTKSTDPNGVSSSAIHDSFGRIIETKSPTNVSSVELRDFDNSVTVDGRMSSFFTLQRTGKINKNEFLAETKTFYDNQGRVLRVDQEGFKGCSIYQDSKYDVRGRANRSSLPYFAETYNNQTSKCESIAEPNIYWSLNEYDSLDRAISVTAPDEGISKTSYQGLKTVVTDANGKTSTKIVNEKGLTLKTIDNAKGELQFVYGPGDRLLKTVQVDGLETVHKYDQIGNKVKSVDPDLGEWNYRYNSFGEVVWQQDAKGQITTVTYDSLGRPLKRHMPDKLDEFTYDSVAFGIGKPATVSNSQGFQETYTYDNLGRLERKATRIHQELYSTFVSYDEYNRVVRANHPGNYAVTNRFDEQGFLSKVLANDPLAPILSEPTVHWSGTQRDQYGRVTEEALGNGVVNFHSYDPKKGNLSETKSGKDGDRITELSFQYDLVGNLRSKADDVDNRFEKYEYDNLDRLTKWTVDGKIKGQYEFDAAGRILSKTGIGKYEYEQNGPAHGVSRIVAPNGKEMEYHYDANGNMISSPKGHFGYYANNSVKHIYASDERWSRFEYAPDGSRIFQHYSETKKISKKRSVTNVRTTVSVGAYERISDHGGSFIIKPGGFQRHRLYVSSDTGVVAVLEHATEFDPLFNETKFKKAKVGTPLATAEDSSSAHYLHKDHLGSIIKVTNVMGSVVSGYRYDPWGKKLQTKWMAKGKEDFAGHTFKRGFTGHEHLDNLDLIHMNGRVYDPDIARFVSADPTLQFPAYGQNYDRYSYVINNPLAYNDPSGFGLGKFFKKLGKAIAKPFEKVGKWIEKNWKEIVIVVVTIAAVVLTGPGGALAMNAIFSGMVVGAVSAGVSTALYGGSIGDVLGAMAMGAVIGGISGGIADAIGTYGLQNGWAEGGIQKVAAHGTAGGLQAEMTGGNFKQGFLSGAIAQSFAPRIGTIRGFAGAQSVRIASAAVIGGTASSIGGGKFVNGAVTAAFLRAYNDELHFDGKKLRWKDDDGKVLAEYAAMSGDPEFQDSKFQSTKNKGSIPEGKYAVRQADYQKMGDRSIMEKIAAEFGRTAWPGGESSWGTQRVWITPDSGTNTYGRGSFSIHGGSSFGSRGCIDLCNFNDRFMSRFRNHGKDLSLTVDY